MKRLQLGSELGELRSLKYLVLRGLWIPCVPKCIGNLTSLLYLHLNLYDLDEPLPASLANLTALRMLTCTEKVRRGSPVVERLVAARGGALDVGTAIGDLSVYVPQVG